MKIKRNAFALSIVLWIVAALMLGVTVLLSFAKDNNNATQEINNKLEAQIINKEILEILKYYIMTSNSEYITLMNSSKILTKYKLPNKLILDDTLYNIADGSTIQLMDTSGLLNILGPIPKFLVAGASLKNTQRQLSLVMEDSLNDWIDTDGSVRLNGAEDTFYKMKKRKMYGTRNHKFMQDIEELRLVNGFDEIPQSNWNILKQRTYFGVGQTPNLLLISSEQLEVLFNLSSLRAKDLIQVRKHDKAKYLALIRELDDYVEDYYSSGYSMQIRIKIISKKGRAISKLSTIISFKPTKDKLITIMGMELE